MRIDQDSNGNTINGNTVNQNDILLANDTGIEVQGDDNTIRSNTVNGNSTGIAVSGDDNVVRGNTTNDNPFDGIAVSGQGNLIQGNTASGNGFGFGDDLADYTTAAGADCTNNTWKSNNGGTTRHANGCENG